MRERRELMKLTTGRYAESGAPATLRSRLFWLRHNTVTVAQRLREGLSADTGDGGSYLCRDWGVWMVRPSHGFRSRRWISVPLRATRSISRDDREAATEWFVAVAAI
jgi:hypothetical protein